MKDKIIARITSNVYIRQNDFDEYVGDVKDNPDANYHTDCKQDAFDTARAIVAELVDASGEPVVVKATIHCSTFNTWITAEMSDGTETELFQYFRDEISFSAREFIGKTHADALALKFKRDRNYLR